MKGKLIFTYTNNGKISFSFHRIALFVLMVLSTCLLIDSELSRWLVFPIIIVLGVFIIDVDTVLSEASK